MSKDSDKTPKDSLKDNSGPDQNYRGQDLSGHAFLNQTFTEADFTQSILEGSIFTNCQLHDARFHAVRGRNASFKNCDMMQLKAKLSDFESSEFNGVSMKGAELQQATLFGSRFIDSDLSGAQLIKADLRKATLSNVNLSDANLNGADLAGANLEGAILSGVQAHRTRITDIKGLNDDQKEILFAAGAYQGLPPAISKISNMGANIGRRAAKTFENLNAWAKTESSTDEIDIDSGAIEEKESLFDKIRVGYEDWQSNKQKIAERRVIEEAEWKGRQDEERKERRIRRLKREQLRIENKQKKKEIRKRQQALKKRMKDRSGLRKELEKQISDIRQEIQTLIQEQKQATNWEAYESPETQSANRMGEISYQAAINALDIEQDLRKKLLIDPSNNQLQSQLRAAEQDSEKLANKALEAEYRHLDKLEEMQARHIYRIAKDTGDYSALEGVLLKMRNRSSVEEIELDIEMKEIMTSIARQDARSRGGGLLFQNELQQDLARKEAMEEMERIRQQLDKVELLKQNIIAITEETRIETFLEEENRVEEELRKGLEEIEALHRDLLKNDDFVDSTSIIKNFKDRLKSVQKSKSDTQKSLENQELERLQAEAEEKLREQQFENVRKRTELLRKQIQDIAEEEARFEELQQKQASETAAQLENQQAEFEQFESQRTIEIQRRDALRREKQEEKLRREQEKRDVKDAKRQQKINEKQLQKEAKALKQKTTARKAELKALQNLVDQRQALYEELGSTDSAEIAPGLIDLEKAFYENNDQTVDQIRLNSERLDSELQYITAAKEALNQEIGQLLIQKEQVNREYATEQRLAEAERLKAIEQEALQKRISQLRDEMEGLAQAEIQFEKEQQKKRLEQRQEETRQKKIDQTKQKSLANAHKTADRQAEKIEKERIAEEKRLLREAQQALEVEQKKLLTEVKKLSQKRARAQKQRAAKIAQAEAEAQRVAKKIAEQVQLKQKRDALLKGQLESLSEQLQKEALAAKQAEDLRAQKIDRDKQKEQAIAQQSERIKAEKEDRKIQEKRNKLKIKEEKRRSDEKELIMELQRLLSEEQQELQFELAAQIKRQLNSEKKQRQLVQQRIKEQKEFERSLAKQIITENERAVEQSERIEELKQQIADIANSSDENDNIDVLKRKRAEETQLQIVQEKNKEALIREQARLLKQQMETERLQESLQKRVTSLKNMLGQYAAAAEEIEQEQILRQQKEEKIKSSNAEERSTKAQKRSEARQKLDAESKAKLQAVHEANVKATIDMLRTQLNSLAENQIDMAKRQEALLNKRQEKEILARAKQERKEKLKSEKQQKERLRLIDLAEKETAAQMERLREEQEAVGLALNAGIVDDMHGQIEVFEDLLGKALKEDLQQRRGESALKESADAQARKLAKDIRDKLLAEQNKREKEAADQALLEKIQARQKERALRLSKRQEAFAKLRSEVEQELAMQRMNLAERVASQEIEADAKLAVEKLEKAASIDPSSKMQQKWYKLTDKLAAYSPGLARQMDAVKETLESELANRRSAAVRARERQKLIDRKALEERRQQEHQNRIDKLRAIQQQEERKETLFLEQESKRQQAEVEAQRIQALRELPAPERHQAQRNDFGDNAANWTPLAHRGADLRGYDRAFERLYNSIFRQCRLNGAKFESAGLLGSDFSQSILDGARFDQATMDGAILEKASLIGANLALTSMVGVQARIARFMDANLRDADCSGSNFEHADLTGANAHKVDFSGADLSNACFVATQLSHAAFRGSILDNAVFDQADLTLADFTGASVNNANFSGARGLDKATIEMLRSKGARLDPDSSGGIGKFIGISQFRAAVVLFALGGGAYFFTSSLGPGDPDLSALEEEAKALSLIDPAEASLKYEEMALQSTRIKDRVAYLIEAASLAEISAQIKRAQDLLAQALIEADEDSDLQKVVRIRSAEFYVDLMKYDEALSHIKPLLSSKGMSAADRARLTIMTEQVATALEMDVNSLLEPLFDWVKQSPQVYADYLMALAEARAENQDPIRALAALDAANALELPEKVKLRLIEVRARVQERGGDFDGALITLTSLMGQTESDSLTWQAAALSKADIQQRLGDYDAALTLTTTLLNQDADAKIKGRSYLIQGRIFEAQENIQGAIDSYRGAIEVKEVEKETMDEARVSLARMLLESGDPDAALSLAELPASALAQARLGEARRLLDSNKAQLALTKYKAIIADKELDEAIIRAAQAGAGEALSAMGEFIEAQKKWRSLLTKEIPASERRHIEVLLANGMLQSGDSSSAMTAFASLSKSKEKEYRVQGLLGMAETARHLGERERAKTLYRQVLDQNPESGFRLQAWQELALIASEQGKFEDAVIAWKSISNTGLGSESIRSDAVVAIANGLSEQGQFEKAAELCEDPSIPSQGQISCANLLESYKPDAALLSYTNLASKNELGASLRAEAALGAARLSKDTAWIEMGLTLVENDIPTELQLIGLALAYESQFNASRLQNLKDRRMSLGELRPNLVAQSLMETSTALRNMKQPQAAMNELQAAIDLNLDDETKEIMMLEKADLHFEMSEWDQAQNAYKLVGESGNTLRAFSAKLGMANSLHSMSATQKALEIVNQLTPPNEASKLQQTEIKARLLTSLEDPSAYAMWAEYANISGQNQDAKFEAIKGQAESKFANDHPNEALTLYFEAYDAAIEDAQKGWAKLGIAESQLALNDLETAEHNLRELTVNQNREVATQALIRLAQMQLKIDPKIAIETLKNKSAFELGPAWDASMEEVRSQANAKSGEGTKAISILMDLAKRWPDNEEAQLPAWLGLADMHKSLGQIDRAFSWAIMAKVNATDPNYIERANVFIQGLDI